MKKQQEIVSKDDSIRIHGQRTLSSSFLSNRSSNSQGDVKIKLSETRTGISLSDFLNRKLHRSDVLPSSNKGKESPMSPLLDQGDATKNNKVNQHTEQRVGADKFPIEFVIEQFKCASNTKEDRNDLSANNVVGSSSMNNLHGSRKRTSMSSLIKIGDGPEPPHLNLKRKTAEQSVPVNKKPRQLFNHYGNGRGWWDGNMEGVDEEEVGSKEMWEGVGSSTLGGLEWH